MQLMNHAVAILCSGQGGQHSGMFDFLAGCVDAEPVFASAGQYLGEDPRRFVREASLDALFKDRIGQILCCTQALAVWAGLREARPARGIIAGYSVGELAAWGCAGSLDAAGTLWLAERRSKIMDVVAPPDSGLAGIIGLRRDSLDSLLLKHGADIAIINDVDSFVIGGHTAALDACCCDALANGAKRAVRIRVTVPSHTKLMAAAVEPFSKALLDVAPRLPHGRYRLLSGIDGDTVRDMQTGCEKLARQVCTPVNWAACLQACREADVELVLELGPGTALSRMAAPLFPADRVRSAEEFRTLAGLRAWLSRSSD
jgi:[acyl-carrier-protein] S-malonyltransferase